MLKKCTWLFALLFTLATGLSSAFAQPVGNTKLMGTAWVLESLNSKLPVLEAQITLEFRTWVLGGWDGCNWYGGPYKARPKSFEAGAMMQTLMGCGGAVARQEKAYKRMLYKIAAYRVKGNRLELYNDAGKVTLQFKQRVELPMNPAELPGTEWQLRTFKGKNLPDDVLVTLEFPEAKVFEGVSGCADYTGNYIAKGNNIKLNGGRDYSRCDEELKGAYSFIFGEVTDYQLKGDKLELLTDKGETYLFVPR